ncbi:MAG: hypothetical protein P4L44_08895 [Oryzomonas sp.]|uniref:hypothetical protein n=1 Tax=Oryzomonas sp. TaxID=2855186 RepID=UPI002848FB3B|nr:hypothetical protein [Oryzomonas sp.]MDR3580064.1 hypothetical protein [Oryzomonas sp.]
MFAIGAPELFFIILPFISFVGWLIYYIKKKDAAILAFSILLIILDIQHILKLVRKYDAVTSTVTYSVVIFAGVGLFILGVYGFIFCVVSMSKNASI